MIRIIRANYLALIFITIYFLLSIIKIEYPGVNNDQLMFVNTATFNPDNFFLWKSWNGIPMMIFPYIGALKSYLYIPIFYLFGVSIWSIRLPQIILICFTLLILYKTLTIAFNKKIALLSILFLSLDPSIIIYSKTDQGPTVLEFLFKVLAVYLLFLFLSSKKKIYFLAIFPVLALGIFNKLNFIWFVNASIFSLLVFYWSRIYEEFKSYGKLAPLFVLGIPYLLLVKLFLRVSKEVSLSYRDFADPVALSNIFQNIVIYSNNLMGIINGDISFKTIYGVNATPIGIYFSTFILLILFVGIGYEVVMHKQSNKHYYFFISIILLIIFQSLLTKQAISAWHVLAIFPFLTIFIAIAVLQLKRISVPLIIAIIFYQMVVNYSYIIKYSQPTKAVAYTSKIYDLIDFTKKMKIQFICLDVDICNQLLSFNQEVNKYKEPFFYLDPQTYNYSFIKMNDNFSKPEHFLYIAHGDSSSHFPELKKQFFQYLGESNIEYEKVREFKDGEMTAFELFKVGI